MPANVVYVIDHGWHTDLGIPAAALRGPLERFRQVFPGMRVLIAGFGRRTFMTAPARNLGDFLIGPFPGDGALLVAGLTAPPDQAYADGTVARLTLPPGGAAALSDFVWSTLRLDDHGQPVMIAPGFFAGSRFYATRIGYSGLYTCNSWTADALHAARLLPSTSGVVFADQVMRPASRVAVNACRIGVR